MRAEFQTALGQLLEMGYQVAATPGTAEYYFAQSQRPDLLGGDAEKGDLTHSPPYSIRQAGGAAESSADSSAALFAHIVALAKPTDTTTTTSSSSSASNATTAPSPSPSPTAGSVLGRYTSQSPYHCRPTNPPYTYLPTYQSIEDWIKERKIDLVINIPEGSTRGDEVTSGYLMRRAAVDFGTSLLTNIK